MSASIREFKQTLSNSGFLLTLYSILLLIMLVSHVKGLSLIIDKTTLSLLLLLIIPWCIKQIPLYVESFGYGDIKLKFRELEKKVDVQHGKVVEQQEKLLRIVKYTMSASTYRHLWHIHQGRKSGKGFEYLYHDNPPFRREMYFLRDHGFIRPAQGISFIDFDKEIEGRNLVELVELTPIGYDYVDIRGPE